MRGDEAKNVLLSLGQPPVRLLAALRQEIRLNDEMLSGVVGRSAQTVRRWRRSGEGTEIPDESALAIDDLRTIVAMLLEAGFDGITAKRFMLSRNIGLGQDRPLDGIRAGLEAFRRVQHVTECFVNGIAPEPGPALPERDGEELEPALTEPPTAPDMPRQPAGAGF